MLLPGQLGIFINKFGPDYENEIIKQSHMNSKFRKGLNPHLRRPKSTYFKFLTEVGRLSLIMHQPSGCELRILLILE
jgi:hypothetical protein